MRSDVDAAAQAMLLNIPRLPLEGSRLQQEYAALVERLPLSDMERLPRRPPLATTTEPRFAPVPEPKAMSLIGDLLQTASRPRPPPANLGQGRGKPLATGGGAVRGAAIRQPQEENLGMRPLAMSGRLPLPPPSLPALRPGLLGGPPPTDSDTAALLASRGDVASAMGGPAAASPWQALLPPPIAAPRIGVIAPRAFHAPPPAAASVPRLHAYDTTLPAQPHLDDALPPASSPPAPAAAPSVSTTTVTSVAIARLRQQMYSLGLKLARSLASSVGPRAAPPVDQPPHRSLVVYDAGTNGDAQQPADGAVSSPRDEDPIPSVEVILRECGRTTWSCNIPLIADIIKDLEEQLLLRPRDGQLAAPLSHTADHVALHADGTHRSHHILAGAEGGGGGSNAAAAVSSDPFEDFMVDDEDVAVVRHRAQRAFEKTVWTFRQQLSEKAAEVDTLRRVIADREPGGGSYGEVQRQLDDSRNREAESRAKLRSLMKLLERASATIRTLEEKAQEEADNMTVVLRRDSAVGRRKSTTNLGASGGGKVSGTGSGGGGAAGAGGGGGTLSLRAGLNALGPQWEAMKPFLPDLMTDDREDHAILRDVCEGVEKLYMKCGDLEMGNEALSDQYAEKDAAFEAATRDLAMTRSRFNAAQSAIEGLNLNMEGLRAELAAAHETYATAKRAWELEKDKLIARVFEVEQSIRTAVEFKPYFVGLGRSRNVAPFLRYEGRVRNLAMPKKDVEELIGRIWTARDAGSWFHKSLSKFIDMAKTASRRALVERGGSNGALVIMHDDGDDAADHPSLMGADPAGSSLVAALMRQSDSAGLLKVEAFVDYDNVGQFVRLPAYNFVEHLTQFLLDHFRGDAGDDDGQTGGDGGGPVAGESSSKKRAGASGAAGSVTAVGPSAAAKGGKTVKGKKGGGAAGTAAAQSQGAGGVVPNFVFHRAGFVNPARVAEVAYSLMEGCEKFKYDADVELFRRVAKEEINEMCYFDQVGMLAKFRAVLLCFGDWSGVIPFIKVRSAMKSFFIAKSGDSLESLMRALLAEIPGADTSGDGGHQMDDPKIQTHVFSISKLFASNEHGNQGPFLEAVRDQHLEELCTHHTEVIDAIIACGATSSTEEGGGGHHASSPSLNENASNEGSPTGGLGRIVVPPPVATGCATLAKVREALQQLDPLKPVEDVNAFILDAVHVYHKQQQFQLARPQGADGADDDDEADLESSVHLNQAVHCEKLAEAAKTLFVKRYGAAAVDREDLAKAFQAAVDSVTRQQQDKSQTPPPPPASLSGETEAGRGGTRGDEADGDSADGDEEDDASDDELDRS